MCSAISSRCLCRHCTTNDVKRDWNCNAIVATSISSEIHIQRLQIVLLLRFNSNFLTSSHPFSHASSLFPFSILGSECDHYFFLFSPLPSPSIFFPSFYFGKRVRPLLFFFYSPLPSPSIFFPSFYFGKRVQPLLFSLFSSPFPLYIFSVFLFWEKSATITFFLFSPLHSASLCFTSFVFCGVNFRHFLTTLLTNNDKEPVKKAKKCFSRPFFLSSSKLFALYTNRTEKMS